MCISLKTFCDHEQLIQIQTDSEARKLEIVSFLAHLPRIKFRALFLQQCLMASLTPKPAQGVNYSSHLLHPPLCFSVSSSTIRRETQDHELKTWQVKSFSATFWKKAHIVLAYAWQTFREQPFPQFVSVAVPSCVRLHQSVDHCWPLCLSPVLKTASITGRRSIALFHLHIQKCLLLKRPSLHFWAMWSAIVIKAWLFHCSH